jgi:hypothetical protein
MTGKKIREAIKILQSFLEVLVFIGLGRAQAIVRVVCQTLADELLRCV